MDDEPGDFLSMIMGSFESPMKILFF